MTRPVSCDLRGNTLRIVDREHFRVVYTMDNWATTLTMESRPVGYPGSFADIATPPDRDGQDCVYAELAGAESSGPVAGKKY